MNRLVVIQENVPMCEECGGGMKLNKLTKKYKCYHCGKVYTIISVGKTDRELICEQEDSK